MTVARTVVSQSSSVSGSGKGLSLLPSPQMILATVAREAGLDPDKVSLDSTLAALDISSLDLISVLFALEEQFNIAIVPEDIVMTWTVAEFADYVASLPTR